MVGNFTGFTVRSHRRRTIDERIDDERGFARIAVDGPRRGTSLKDETHHHDDCDHHYLHVVSRWNVDRRSGRAAPPAPPLATPPARNVFANPAIFSLSYIIQPGRLVLRDDRTRTSCPRRLTATKVAIDRYFSEKDAPACDEGRVWERRGIRTTTVPPPQHQLPATRRFTHGAPAAPATAAAVAAPSEGERSTPPGRPESPGYAVSLADPSRRVFLSPSIFSSSDVTGMESGSIPNAHLGHVLSVSRTILTE